MQTFHHQPTNSVGDEVYNGVLYGQPIWPLHVHKAHEIAIVYRGDVAARLGDREYALHEGDAFVAPSFRPHAYDSGPGVAAYIVVFSGSYLPSFDKLMAKRDPKEAAFRLSAETLALTKKLFVAGRDEGLTGNARIWLPKPEPFAIKAGLYAVVAEMVAAIGTTPVARNSDLLYRMIDYIEKNFTEDISLRSMAGELGYDYRYLSRKFDAMLNINFKKLVNQYRCERALQLLGTPGMNLTEVAFGSGFQSIRTFNRVFKEFTGEAPSKNNR